MNAANLKELIELIGILAIVASLIFVGIELRQAQRIAYAEQQGNLIPISLELNDMLARHASLVLKMNSGAELTAEEDFIANRLISSLWSTAFFGYQRWYFLDHPAIEGPVNGLARTLYENPGLRRYWEDYRARRDRNLERMEYSSGTGARETVEGLLEAKLVGLDSVSAN